MSQQRQHHMHCTSPKNRKKSSKCLDNLGTTARTLGDSSDTLESSCIIQFQVMVLIYLDPPNTQKQR